LSMAQLIAIAIVIVGVAIMAARKRVSANRPGIVAATT